ncbi:aromatic ring-hydroxylating dioxygenase subunit alpha [Undibacterium umbellatum]|uniref:Aromatic ring-hydroxylating dioxygenase subunit alpha n=1 Tax=Undibacterium umbellatum TaxID=2762300 RepID=A0ABR6ZB06_9BURK|nr:aromatic ring-hydroxylating dioxygenase subunit alpha [Undibacterium umbellatum]MBC3908530.1 aromatic ring-hydroxylating dioxygenase subunit alpha [Undibacterium umbellatum]
MSGQWNPAVYAYWFVAACSADLRQKPIAVTVLDKPLTLVRLQSGELLALEDRCPHRQVPLSQGQVTAEGLQCPYHGWTFGSGGRCIKVPGLPLQACLPQVGARAFDVKEFDGLIWVRLARHGHVESDLPKLVTDLPTGSRRFLWQTSWSSFIVNALENFLDPLHTHFVHPGLVRKDTQRHSVEAVLTETADGFVVDYRGQVQQSGILYRLFESPRISERAYYTHAGSTQIEYCYQDGSIVRISLHFTPQSADVTHVFATMHIENRWAPAWLLRLLVWPFLKRVASQDAHMLALQTQNLHRFPDACYASTELDQVRRYIEKFWLDTEIKLPSGNSITLYL